MPITDWDDAYSNGIHIPGGDAWPARWDEAAEAFRIASAGTGRQELDRPYGLDPRQTMDLFWPAARPRGLMVYVHGGYWVTPGPKTYSHLAQGALTQGFAVAIPGYRLCPDVRITKIGTDIAAAITLAASLIEGPIHLTGHSAGGHLAARMVCETSPLADTVARRIANVVSISGLHDLRPLRRTSMNQALRLTDSEAFAESPALLVPRAGLSLTCWVGANERPEFLRQNALLANIWRGLGADTRAVEEPGRHHFDIIDGLADPTHALTKTLLSDRSPA